MTTAQQRHVVLPRAWKFVLELQARGTLAVEHAALEVRALEALLATAVARPGERALVGFDADRVRYVLQRWFPELRPRLGSGCVQWRLGRGSLWVVRRPEDAARVPAAGLDLLVVLDAHALGEDPTRLLGTRVVGLQVASGQLAPRGHWWYDWARRADRLVRLPAELVLESFPDQAALVPPRHDPRRRRLFDLEDVAPSRTPLARFARTRLKVRTSKPPSFLSPLQRAEAERQFGSDWVRSGLAPVVSADLLPIQRRVEALERLGRARGYRKFLTVKYRRLGETSRHQMRNYRDVVEMPGTHGVSIADVDDRAVSAFAAVKLFHERDPYAPPLTSLNTHGMELANGSAYHVGTAGGSVPGRGLGFQFMHGTEVPYWCKGDRDAVHAVMVGLLEAVSHGEVRLEGTPAGRGWFYEVFRDARRGLNDWWAMFLRWFDDPLNVADPDTYDPLEVARSLSDEERALVARHGLSPGQVAFRRQKQRDLGWLFPQEYPEDDEQCWLTSGVSYFDVPVVLALLAAVPAPPDVRQVPGGREVRWEPPQPGVRYVAGCDTSEGLPTSDPAGVVILRQDTGAQVADLHGCFRPPVLAHHAVRLCREYNQALLGVERNNHGHAVLQKVDELGYGHPHFRGGPLYWHAATDAYRQDQRDARAGWDTNAVTRPNLLSGLAEWLPAGGVRDRELLAECLTFRLQASGKFEADSGAHDDRVMKVGIAVQMLRQALPPPAIVVLGENGQVL